MDFSGTVVTSSGSIPRQIRRKIWISTPKNTLPTVNRTIQPTVLIGGRGAAIETSQKMGHAEFAAVRDWQRAQLRKPHEELHKGKQPPAVRIDSPEFTLAEFF